MLGHDGYRFSQRADITGVCRDPADDAVGRDEVSEHMTSGPGDVDAAGRVVPGGGDDRADNVAMSEEIANRFHLDKSDVLLDVNLVEQRLARAGLKDAADTLDLHQWIVAIR